MGSGERMLSNADVKERRVTTATMDEKTLESDGG